MLFGAFPDSNLIVDEGSDSRLPTTSTFWGPIVMLVNSFFSSLTFLFSCLSILFLEDRFAWQTLLISPQIFPAFEHTRLTDLLASWSSFSIHPAFQVSHLSLPGTVYFWFDTHFLEYCSFFSHSPTTFCISQARTRSNHSSSVDRRISSQHPCICSIHLAVSC